MIQLFWDKESVSCCWQPLLCLLLSYCNPNMEISSQKPYRSAASNLSADSLKQYGKLVNACDCSVDAVASLLFIRT